VQTHARPHPTVSRLSPPARRSARRPHPPYAIGLRTITFVDRRREIVIPGRSPQPRTLVTVVRYPARGQSSQIDVEGAAPARSGGPFPLVVFGHGYNETPAPYAPLLQAWAQAGYVVVAPIFPLENSDAPGGPNEHDLINQPADMSFVITRMLALSGARKGFFSSLIDRREVAVAGQSDGGETALSVAYNRYFLDRRVRAAVILSGAKIPGVGGFDFPRPSPPLLATQGTADTINPPSFTRAFFDVAPPPKYLLMMFAAAHLGPYTGEQPQLGVVERVTIAFLGGYLKGDAAALARIVPAGDVPGTSAVMASTSGK
jgi:dienelactone hydrolase